MNRSGPGQSSSSSRGPNHSRWRNNNNRETLSDDDRQNSRRISKSSSSRPVPSAGLTHSGSNTHTRDGAFEARTSLPQSSPLHGRNIFPRPDGSRAMKSFSTPSSPNVRGPPPQPSRSNPTAPVWGFGPGQPRKTLNVQRTPHRNFQSGYISAPSTLRGPGRKAGSGAPMWNPANEPRSLRIPRMIAEPRPRPQMEITKSTKYPTPFWQQQDAVHEGQQRTERLMHKHGELSSYTGSKGSPMQMPRRAYLNPALRVVEDDGASDADDDENKDGDVPMDVDEVPPPRPPPRQKFVGVKTGDGHAPRIPLASRKAARKFKWPAPKITSPSDSSSTSSSSESDSSSSNSVIELTDSESDEHTQEEKGKRQSEPLSDSEIIIVEPPQPRITIPLPQIAPAAPRTSFLPPGPPDELITALDEFCLGSIRMQATKQLPFLVRNLRRGFRLRCNAIGIKATRSKPRMPVLARYEYTEKIYETRMSKWLCLLCELHGAFPNKEMLRCHLHWDHPEVILERWEQRTNNHGISEWRIHLLVPEIIHETIQPRTLDITPKIEFQGASIEPEAHIIAALPETEGLESTLSATPVPPMEASQVPSEPPETRDATPTVDTVDSTLVIPRKFELAQPVRVKILQSELFETTPRSHRAPITPSHSSRSRSINTEITQETEEQPLSTVRVEHTPGPPGGIYPSPPPVHDPLGPAAQAPYLPAKSEYEGPDIEYSCRPAGATTFDLLGTLPLEPFGVLDWDIVEREEEIYESDEIRVEYKVMHALWLRWIMLNRTQFMQNYYKGVIAFINAYWRMIHQAAGWRAIRYWLLLLLTQGYLNGREAAKALKHYEGLTGMTHW